MTAIAFRTAPYPGAAKFPEAGRGCSGRRIRHAPNRLKCSKGLSTLNLACLGER